MKRSKFNVLLVAGLLAGLMAGCTEPGPIEPPPPPPPPPTTGSIIGTISLFPSVVGDLSNARVSVYATLDDLYAGPEKAVRFTTLGSGRSSRFELNGLNPDNYFVEVWLDLNPNGFRDIFFLLPPLFELDLYALCDPFQNPTRFFFQAAPFQVRAGETVTIDMIVPMP